MWGEDKPSSGHAECEVGVRQRNAVWEVPQTAKFMESRMVLIRGWGKRDFVVGEYRVSIWEDENVLYRVLLKNEDVLNATELHL